MFDLNEQIARWRAGLAESEAYSTADIDELEAHLREEVGQLTAAGLSEQEAFLVAGRRLGDAAALENEFAKVNGRYILRKRLFWMTAGAFAYLLAACLAGACGNAGAFIGARVGLGAYAAAVAGLVGGTLGYGVILLLASLACRPNSNLSRFGGLTLGLRGQIVLFGSLVLVVAALGAATVLFSVLMTRTMGVEYIGRLAHISAYVHLLLPIVLPATLLAVLIKLRVPTIRTARR